MKMEKDFIRVAICDENKQDCLFISQSLNKILDKENESMTIDTYENGEILCKEHKAKGFDLIFLKVEIGGVSGIEAGRYIREHLQDEIVQIAYISNNKDYAMNLFEFRPINFLIKPLIEHELEKVIRKFLLLSKRKQSKFIYKRGYEFIEINTSDILYFYSQHRKVCVVMRDGKDEFYGKLDDIHKNICSKYFLSIHKSYLVNYQFIKQIDYKKIWMINGEELPISQSRRKDIKQQFNFLRKQC